MSDTPYRNQTSPFYESPKLFDIPPTKGVMSRAGDIVEIPRTELEEVLDDLGWIRDFSEEAFVSGTVETIHEILFKYLRG